MNKFRQRDNTTAGKITLNGITDLSLKGIFITPGRGRLIPLALLFFHFLLPGLSAQPSDAGDQAKDLKAAQQAYQTLKKGYLLVILPTYHTQLEHLAKLKAKAPDSKNTRQLNQTITALQARRDMEQQEIRSAFSTQYKLSPTRFILDSDYLPGDSTHNNRLMLDADGKYNVALSQGNTPWLLAGVIEKNYKGNYKRDLNIMYPDYRRVPAPFPDRIRTHLLFFKKSMDRNVKKLQQKLDKFAAKYMK